MEILKITLMKSKEPKSILSCYFLVFAILFASFFSGCDNPDCVRYRDYLCLNFQGILHEKTRDNRSGSIIILRENGEFLDIFSSEVLWNRLELGDSIKKVSGDAFCTIKSEGEWIPYSIVLDKRDSTYCSSFPKYCNCN